ncbi:MAG: hypothetical protein VX205_00250 [Pseudomonadota bacterium]|nr:hypothetical protein [Pseudomonadota bacterium]
MVKSLVLTLDYDIIDLVDNVDVVPAATDHEVSAGSAVDQVVALGAEQTVIARIAADIECAITIKIAIDDIIAVAGIQRIYIIEVVDIQVMSCTNLIKVQILLIDGEGHDIVSRSVAVGIDFDGGHSAGDGIFDLSRHPGEGIDHCGADAGRVIGLDGDPVVRVEISDDEHAGLAAGDDLKIILPPAAHDTILATCGLRALPVQKIIRVARSDDIIRLPGQMEYRSRRRIDNIIQTIGIKGPIV